MRVLALRGDGVRGLGGPRLGGATEIFSKPPPQRKRGTQLCAPKKLFRSSVLVFYHISLLYSVLSRFDGIFPSQIPAKTFFEPGIYSASRFFLASPALLSSRSLVSGNIGDLHIKKFL